MAEKMRYNKIIDLLEHGKPVFSTSTVPNGSLEDLTYIADADYDAVIIEMEHEGFSFTTLRTSLQVLLNRKRIAEKGNLQPDVVPMVRIPPNARERNQWVIKQALDMGVYGLVLPHLSTVEDAQAAVAAARYPQVPGVQDFAAATAYLLVLISKDGSHRTLPPGRYECELIKENDGLWRFSRRTVFHDHDYVLEGIGR